MGKMVFCQESVPDGADKCQEQTAPELYELLRVKNILFFLGNQTHYPDSQKRHDKSWGEFINKSF